MTVISKQRYGILKVEINWTHCFSENFDTFNPDMVSVAGSAEVRCLCKSSEHLEVFDYTVTNLLPDKLINLS